MEIRIAQEEDVPYLLDIYNYEVLHGGSDLRYQPQDAVGQLDWYYAHNISNHPCNRGGGGRPCGRLCLPVPLSCEGGLCGYRGTVCLRPQGLPEAQEIARKLTLHILNLAREDERIHTVVSVSPAEIRPASICTEELGFLHCGTIKEVGVKFGRYLDIENYQMMV